MTGPLPHISCDCPAAGGQAWSKGWEAMEVQLILRLAAPAGGRLLSGHLRAAAECLQVAGQRRSCERRDAPPDVLVENLPGSGSRAPIRMSERCALTRQTPPP